MALPSWRGVGPAFPLYATAGVAGAVAVWWQSPVSSLRTAMVGFAFFFLLVNWSETRWTFERVPSGKIPTILAIGLTVLMLVVWAGMVLSPSDRLPLYFVLVGASFFLQAVRDTAVLDLSLIELSLHGYAMLVVFCLLLAAIANAIGRGHVLLVFVIATVFLVRKLYAWVPAIIAWISPDFS